jgi:hypothetical protein
MIKKQVGIHTLKIKEWPYMDIRIKKRQGITY